MEKLIIKGGFPLCGEVAIQGAKNAAQKILPATVAFSGEYILRNVPFIQDSLALIAILRFLGADIEVIGDHLLRVNTHDVMTKEIPPEVTATSTGTFLFAGALLSRFGEVKIWHPGGDKIGKRPVTWHLAAFRALGASVTEQPAYYEVRARKLRGNTTISFARPTANGTVNAVIASAHAQGVTLIENIAPEPEIHNFVAFMRAIGARVEWREENRLRVEGVEQGFGSGEIDIIPDRNDAATFLIAAALGHGPVTLRPFRREHLLPLLDVLARIGVQYEEKAPLSLTVHCEDFRPIDVDITSRPFPGFSTDWGPMMQVLLTQVPGTSLFHETIFSQRFAHVRELIKMGAPIQEVDLAVHPEIYNFEYTPGTAHALRIQGPGKLQGAQVNANDVRAGAALALAGLIASGQTEITGIEQIQRGYEAFEKRLSALGASIHVSEINHR